METNYPTLKRPKRKLCYLTNKDSAAKKWTGTLTLGDVDKIFDDMDSSSVEDVGLAPLSPLLQNSNPETHQSETEVSLTPKEEKTAKLPGCQWVSAGDTLNPTAKLPSPILETYFDMQHKWNGPVQTSSPIEANVVVGQEPNLDNDKGKVVSPILFLFEEETEKEAAAETVPSQKPQCNGHVKEDEVSHPVKVKTAKTTQAKVLDGKRQTEREDEPDQPVPAEREEPELPTDNSCLENVQKLSTMEVSTRVNKDMTLFLQKLRETVNSRTSRSRKSPSPEKAPTPPEPEDDFLILEEDKPLWISIPTKGTASKKRRQSRTSSTDRDSSTNKDSSTDKGANKDSSTDKGANKDSSTDKGANKDSSTDKGAKKDSSAEGGSQDSQPESEQKQPETEQVTRKPESKNVTQKSKRKKQNERKNEETEPENNLAELPPTEGPPEVTPLEQEKPSKKKRLKKAPSKESGKPEELPIGTASSDTDGENPALNIETKAPKTSELKTKSGKNKKENVKTDRTKSAKRGRNVPQESEEVTEAGSAETVEAPSQEPEGVADQGLQDDIGSQTEEDSPAGEEQQIKPQQVSDGSSPEVGQILGKRKRRPTGQWWSCQEQTKASDNEPAVKKKQKNIKEPITAAVRSPKKAKKEKVSKRKNQTETVPSLSQDVNKGKGKKPKQSKRTSKVGETPNRKKATEAAVDETERGKMEEPEQQEEAQHQEPDGPEEDQSSPLNLTHRNHSTGGQLFQRVYHHVSVEKQSNISAPVSPSEPWEQSGAEEQKRRRKPPGNWWTVNGQTQEVENIVSQPQHRVKQKKERNKQNEGSRSARLGTPKNGNMAVSSKPAEGAHVSPLKVRPLSGPKTVKRSLATFKNIFTSAGETPAVMSSTQASQKNTHAVSVTELSASVKGFPSVDAAESSSLQNHNTSPENKHQSENMSFAFRSGPQSMIELQDDKEDDSFALPSSSVRSPLSVLDLCAPPLKPLVLQPQDEANLTEWFKSLWSASVDKGPEVMPDQFDWYFHQGRALGLMEDLNCGTICNGKVLLGSYMKKPLWVDHSATSVFNLLTSSVSVTINGSESRFNPGQSFMVQCGHAYSIKNLSAQPAVLYFTRVVAESLD